jgi:prophage maintenance system killer protein
LRRTLRRPAALLHSIARNRALVDGNKRLALAAVIAFCGLNGRRLTLTYPARAQAGFGHGAATVGLRARDAAWR